jgi:hypothetical protein
VSRERRRDLEEGPIRDEANQREKDRVKRKPDVLVVLLALFGLGVVVTLLLPTSAISSVAVPASALQAGVIIQE